jgi:hypothetical protein
VINGIFRIALVKNTKGNKINTNQHSFTCAGAVFTFIPTFIAQNIKSAYPIFMAFFTYRQLSVVAYGIVTNDTFSYNKRSF